jgi:3-phenylpropionate/trans-cinnamate dioxygenase ferredoxin subunit
MSGDILVVEFPPQLAAPGTQGASFMPLLPVADMPPGSMRRVSHDDLDLLIAHTGRGLVAVDDRCPHMSAPLSLGSLDGCVVDCVLHKATFDLSTGATLRFPTTGGLDADGAYRPSWQPEGSTAKPEPSDTKARARAMTRTRRLRYYPLRVRNGNVEVALPGA